MNKGRENLNADLIVCSSLNWFAVEENHSVNLNVYMKGWKWERGEGMRNLLYEAERSIAPIMESPWNVAFGRVQFTRLN